LGGSRVEVGNDNLAVVGGFPNFNSAGAAFIKIDESGELLWSNLDADGPLMLLLHAHMLLDRSNNVYLAASNLFSMAVCKVGYDGASGWTATVSGSNSSAIAIGSGDSSVFVVGGATARLINGPPAGTPPGAPSALTSGLLTSTSVDLRWTDNASDETGFTLERCPGTLAFCQSNPAQFTVRATLGANVTAHTDPGLVGGTPYSWRVQAFNAAGRSPFSNTLTVTTPTPTPTPPAAPTNLKASLKGLGIRARVGLTWTDKATDETGYTVQRCAGISCTGFAAIVTLPRNSRTYTDSGVAPGITYRYRVMATGPGGNSAYSNTAQVKTR
ncbi:MAG TPA: fibronectin type III domain-containing protein, partial [Vicinamibacteria bacterium]